MANSQEKKPSTIRVLIVDDHAVVRQGLRIFLELQDDSSAPSIKVVAEAVDGAEAVELASRYQPDVILLDLVMPIMDGIAATPKILRHCPRSRIIILTSFGEEDKVFPAIRAGAHGYLLKDISPEELVRAIRAAHLGQAPLHPDVTQKLMTAVVEAKVLSSSQRHEPVVDSLTERECEVLHLVARGLSNREIASELVIGETTVKSHVSSILDKLHLEDRTQAAIYALRHGLASDEP
ncbi:MAG: response regulator transcription factor [Anaerolineaceae bacterium]|nr:response regulator transcription factor [Anaerolineaceae bacterium]